MKKALTIAGFDPSGGAGIQADLKVFHALDVYGLSAVAALTAQSTRGVKHVHAVSRQFLKKQLDVLLADLIPDATKMGMLLTEENVRVVAQTIRNYALKNVVLDPVMISSSGKRLASRDIPALLKIKILPLCSVITPNIHEASVLSGITIKTGEDREKAAALLREAGPETVIITGGHLNSIALDVVYNGSFHYLKAKKRQGEFHGTGCVFSAAITAYLAEGYSAIDASGEAKAFMAKAFQKTFSATGKLKLFAL